MTGIVFFDNSVAGSVPRPAAAAAPTSPPPASQAVVSGSSVLTAESAGSPGSAGSLTPLRPQCGGDGSSGDRIAFYYAYVAGEPNRLDAVRDTLISVIERANEIVDRSARRYGVDQSLRVLTDAACTPVLQAIRLPAAAAGSFAGTVAASGLKAANRKYVIFTDDDHFCGLGTLDFTDSPGPDNPNNSGPSWARIDVGCWTPLVTAHEIFHMLGAVQNSAPHSNGGGHCTDGYDVMCYAAENGTPLTLVCASRASMFYLDCGGDDYYNPDPAPGSYLATHWNTADSSFLYRSRYSGRSSGGPPATSRETGDDTWVRATGQTR